MWAKRFPVPEFDRHELKNLDWIAPQIEAGPAGGALGCVAVNASPDYYARFDFRGEHLLAVACTLPDTPVAISGNSYAWPIHRAVITDSLDAESCQVIADWKTPRPMNTRFGPDAGITVSSRQAYVLIGHQVADYWVANRIMLDLEWAGNTQNSFRILSSSETEINDFHDAVVYFEWQ